MSTITFSQFVDIDINSGNPSFPFPQFLEYEKGKTLATNNAEGVTHADMEKTMREAYEIMTHRCRYSGESVDGVPYITFNEKGVGVPDDTQPFCSEGDGYILLTAAIFADQPTFNGLWLWMHDNRLNKVTKYGDCQPLRPGQVSGDYMPGWENDETSAENSGETHSASDGDFDMAMGLLIAYKQWGEFMMQDGKQVIDACGQPISYKDAAERFIKALVDTIPNYNNNGGFAGYISGDIGIDGYVKSGNTWGELTAWRHGTQTTYPWAVGRPTLGSAPSEHYFDYNAPSYFNEFAYWLEFEDGNGSPWQINQFKRAEASSDFLIGEAYKQGNIASIGKVRSSDGLTFTFGPFNSGEDFRAAWRTTLNYLWHGNPTYTWDPVTHQVVPGGNTFEYDMALRHAEHCKAPSLGGVEKCKKMGASPDPGQPEWWGVAQIPQAWGQTGETELHFAGSNYALGASAPTVVAAEDLELISDMYRQSELVWDDASASSSGLSEDERYILSTPKYFHGMFRVLGLLTNSGNLHAPRNMTPAANVKVYMDIDKTYAYQGDKVEYTVQYRNYGSKKAEKVVITTPLDPDYTFVSADNNGVYNSGSHSITWDIGEIDGFKTGELDKTIDSVSFVVKITDLVNSRVCLTSTISGENFSAWESNEYPNHATYTMERNCIDVLANRTLKVKKQANRTNMNPKDIVKFTVDFENESTEDAWLNGGRSNVYLSYGNYLPSINDNSDWSNTSFYQFYRFWHDGAEAYINMNNYRVSYYMNDVNKGFKSATNANGWIFSVDNQNDLDKYNYNPATGPITFDYQKVPLGSDNFGSWNQRIMIRFAKVLTAPSTHVYDKLDSDYLLHKGVTGPGFIRSRLFTDPATNMKAKVADDWSYDSKLQNVDLAAQGSLFFPVSPSWADYNNQGASVDNFARHSCSPDVDNYDRILVEEFDGFTWRRIQGRGPLPGKEAYNVVIVDTIPLELEWAGFEDDNGLGATATYKPAPANSKFTGIVELIIPIMLVGEKDELVYNAKAKDIGCPAAADVYFENAAWIYSDTDSKDSSKVDLMITCTELPPFFEPQESLFKTANATTAKTGDIIDYELEFINTEGTKVVGDLTTQDGWKALGNGNIPKASGIFSNDPNANPGIPAPYFYANEKSYGVNGVLESTWDVGNSSEFYFVFRYTSGTPYAADFNGVCLRVTPVPMGQGTIRFELLDGTTVVATETANTSYPTNADNSFFPINFKINIQDDKIFIYINDFETVLKSYSGIIKTTPGYVGVYSGPNGNQQKMNSLNTAFDYAFDIKMFDQLPSELDNVTSVSDGGTWDATKNLITWPIIPGPVALNETFTYTYTAEAVACGAYITNIGMATVYGMDTLKVLNSIPCGGASCEAPTSVDISTSDAITFCEGESAILTASAVHSKSVVYEFFNGTTSVQGPGALATFEAKEAGTYTVVARDAGFPNDATCEVLSANSIVITVDPAFKVDLGPDQNICSDAIVDLDAGTGDSFLWSTNETTQTITPTIGVTDYSVTVTRGACSHDTSVVVEITSIPTITDNPATDQSLCSGEDMTYIADITEVGNWRYTLYNGLNAEVGPQTNSDFTIATAGAYSILVESTDNLSCSSKSSGILVVIEAAPTVDLSTPSAQVCDANAEITALAAGTDWVYAFFETGDMTTPVQAKSTDNTYEVTTPGTYVATAYKTNNALCQGTSPDLKIEIGTKPIASVESSSVLEYCKGSSGNIDVTDILGATYEWANGNGSIIAVGNSLPSVTAETYKVTVVEGFCSTTIDNIIVTENPLPSYTITNNGSAAICEGDVFPSITLDIIGTGPFTVEYSDGQGPNQLLTSQTNSITLTPTATTPSVYTFSVIKIEDEITSCKATVVPTEIQLVTINKKPSLVFNAPDGVCDNTGNVDLSTYVSSSDAGTYTYSCTEETLAIDATSGLFDVVTQGAGVYSINVTLDDNGCVSASQQQTFTVFESPTASVIGVTEVCAGVTEVLTGTQTGGTTPYSNHKWTQSGSVLSDVSIEAPTFQTTTVDLYDLTYSFKDANNCNATVSHSVDVVSLPTASVNALPDYCTGYLNIPLDETFANVSVAGGTYVWKVDNVITNQIEPASLGSATNPHTLSLVYTYGCEAAEVSANFNVYKSPTAQIDAPGLLCSHPSTVQLTTSNESPALGTGVWSGTEVDGSGLLDISSHGDLTVNYKYTEPSGVCSITITEVITVDETPVITFPSILNGCFDDLAFSLNASATPIGGIGEYAAATGVSTSGLVTPNTLTPGISYDITYKYTSIPGCENSASQTYLVNKTPIPTVVANPVSTVIPILHNPLEAVGVSDEFRWYDSVGNYKISGQTFNPAHVLAGTYRYALTQELNGCESDALDVSIYVSNCATLAPIVKDTAICDGAPIPELAATPRSAGTIKWYSDALKQDYITTGDTFIPSTLPAVGSSVTYYASNLDGCEGPATPIKLTVNALSAITFSLQDEICQEATSLSLVADPPGGEFTIGGNTVTSFNPSLYNGSQAVLYTYINPTTACESNKTENILVNATPTPTITGLNASYCTSDADVTLTHDLVTGSPEIWSATPAGVNSATGVLQPSIFVGSPTTAITITLNYTDANGCKATPAPTANVTINDLPNVTISNVPAQCASITNIDLDNYVNPIGGTYSAHTALVGTIFNPETAGANNHTISYTYEDPTTHCSTSKNITIPVKALPNVNFDFGLDNILCREDDGVQLSSKVSADKLPSTTVKAKQFSGGPLGSVKDDALLGSVFLPSIADIGTHTISVLYTDIDGCESTVTADVEVQGVNNPIVTGNSGNVQVVSPIVPSTYTLDAVGAGGTYRWFTNDLATKPYGTGTSVVPSEIVVGQHDYYVFEENANGCKSDTLLAMWEVVACSTPEPTITGTQIICEGDNYPIISAIGQGGIYEWYQGTTLLGTGATFKPIVGSNPVYNYTLKEYNSTEKCYGPKHNFTITVNAKPDVRIANNQNSFCFENNTVYDYGVYDFNGTIGTITNNGADGLQGTEDNFLPSSVSTINTEIDLEFYYEDGNGCKDTVKISPTVYKVNQPTVVSPLVENLQTAKGVLSATPSSGGTLTWYNSSMAEKATGVTYTHSPINEVNSWTYYVIEKKGGCQSQPEELVYTIVTCDVGTPTLSQNNPYKICNTETLSTFEATGSDANAEFIWYNEGSPASTGVTAKTFLPTIVKTNTEYGFYVVEKSQCTATPLYFTVEIIDVQEPYLLIPENNGNFCEGDIIEISQIGTPRNLTWYGDVDKNIPYGTGLSMVEPNLEVGTKTMYAVRDSANCSSEMVSVSYTINKMPVQPVIAPEESCTNEDIKILTATGNTSANIKWYNENNNEIASGITFTPKKIQLTAGAITEFTAVAELNGCVSSPGKTTYYYKTIPGKPLVPNNQFCFDYGKVNINTMNAIVSNGTINWFYEDETPIPQCIETTTCESEIPNPGKYTYYLAWTIDGCSSNKYPVEVIVYDKPNAIILGEDKLCENSTEKRYTIQDNTNLDAQNYFNWTITGDRILYKYGGESEGNYRIIDFLTPGIDTLYVTQVQNNCVGKDSLVIKVAPAPKAMLNAYTPGGPGQVYVYNESTQDAIDGSDIVPEVNYFWDFGRGIDTELQQINMDEGGVDSPIDLDYEYGYYDISLYAHNDFGCEATFTQKQLFVDISSAIYFPDALAPNNPAYAVREFKPKGYNLISYEITIYDTWGNILWYSNKLTESGEPAEGWTGMYNGKSLEAGAYIFKCEATLGNKTEWRGIKKPNGLYSKFGSVYLIK